MGAALNDIAYAVNDTIKDPENFKPLNELIQDMITELKNTVNNVNTAVANANTAISNVNTAVGTVNTNLAGGKVPVVRKIQRGVVACSSETSITLSGFGTESKMIVLLNGHMGKYAKVSASSASYAYAYLPHIISFSKSTLKIGATVSGDGTAGLDVSYQVIEFW